MRVTNYLQVLGWSSKQWKPSLHWNNFFPENPLWGRKQKKWGVKIKIFVSRNKESLGNDDHSFTKKNQAKILCHWQPEDAIKTKNIQKWSYILQKIFRANTHQKEYIHDAWKSTFSGFLLSERLVPTVYASSGGEKKTTTNSKQQPRPRSARQQKNTLHKKLQLYSPRKKVDLELLGNVGWNKINNIYSPKGADAMVIYYGIIRKKSP